MTEIEREIEGARDSGRMLGWDAKCGEQRPTASQQKPHSPTKI